MKTVIFSLDSKIKKPTREVYEIYLSEMSSRLGNPNWYIGQGAYKYDDGTYMNETCAIIKLKTEQVLQDVIELALAYNQETILIINSDSNSFLYNLATQKETYIGEFTEVNHIEAKNDPYGYTKIMDLYFVCKPSNNINKEVKNDDNYTD